MLCPCHQNPALLAFKVLKGSSSFDAIPMAPLGTNLLAHHKPNQWLSWGFHALIVWYISPSLQHYRCIKIIMHDTGSKCIINTFRYIHHAILVPKIMITDRILNATCCLTVAIEGIQEAAPDKLQAIKSLCQIFLGKHPPPTTTPTTFYISPWCWHQWRTNLYVESN